MSFLKRMLVPATASPRSPSAPRQAESAKLSATPLPSGSGLPPAAVQQNQSRVAFNADASEIITAPVPAELIDTASPSALVPAIGHKIDPYTGMIIEDSNTPDGARMHRRLNAQQTIEQIQMRSRAPAAGSSAPAPTALKSGAVYDDPYAAFRKRR